MKIEIDTKELSVKEAVSLMKVVQAHFNIELISGDDNETEFFINDIDSCYYEEDKIIITIKKCRIPDKSPSTVSQQ